MKSQFLITLLELSGGTSAVSFSSTVKIIVASLSGDSSYLNVSNISSRG